MLFGVGLTVAVGFVLLVFIESRPHRASWETRLSGSWIILMLGLVGWTLYQELERGFLVILLAPVAARLITIRQGNVLASVAKWAGEGYIIRSLKASAVGLVGYGVGVWATGDPVLGLLIGATLYALLAFNAVSELTNSIFWALLGIIGPALGQVVVPDGTWLLLSVINLILYIISAKVPKRFSERMQIAAVLVSCLAFGLVRNGFVIHPEVLVSRGLDVVLMVFVWNGLLALAYQIHIVTAGLVGWIATPGVPFLLTVLGLLVPGMEAFRPALAAGLSLFGPLVVWRFANLWTFEVPYYAPNETITEFDRWENTSRALLGADLYRRTKWLVTGEPESLGNTSRSALRVFSTGVVVVGLSWFFFKPAVAETVNATSYGGRLIALFSVVVCGRIISGWRRKLRTRVERRLNSNEAVSEIAELVMALMAAWWFWPTRWWPLVPGLSLWSNIGIVALVIFTFPTSLYFDLIQVNYGRFASLIAWVHGLDYLVYTASRAGLIPLSSWAWIASLGSLAGLLRSLHQRNESLAATENQRPVHRPLVVQLPQALLVGILVGELWRRSFESSLNILLFLVVLTPWSDCFDGDSDPQHSYGMGRFRGIAPHLVYRRRRGTPRNEADGATQGLRF